MTYAAKIWFDFWLVQYVQQLSGHARLGDKGVKDG